MARNWTRTVERVAAVGVPVALMGMVLYAAVGWSDPFNAKPFDAAAWATGDVATRAGMARAVVRKHLPPGLPAAAVIKLLGPPGDVRPPGNAPSAGRPAGETTWTYYLGGWSAYGMDAAFLSVSFDANDRVVAADIVGG